VKGNPPWLLSYWLNRGVDVKLDCNIFQLAYAAKECWEFGIWNLGFGDLADDPAELLPPLLALHLDIG